MTAPARTMDFNRIRIAVEHYEDLRRRLTFHVKPWKDESAKPPVTRFMVEPLYAGSPTKYGSYDTEAEAAAVAIGYNNRGERFLADEYAVVRLVLLQEAGT